METLEDLSARLARAERRARALFALVIIILVCEGTVLLARSGFSQGQPQSLTVKAPFRVVDENGTLILQVSAGAKAGGLDRWREVELVGPGLREAKIHLVAGSGYGQVVVNGERGRPLAGLLGFNDESLLALDAPGDSGVKISASEGGGSILIHGKGGKLLFKQP